MKKIVLIITLSLIGKVFSQCRCETMKNEQGATASQCPPEQIGYNKFSSVAMAIGKNPQFYYISLAIRFLNKAQSLTGNLQVWLEDGNFYTFSLYGQNSALIDDSECTFGTFTIDEAQLLVLKTVKLKNINFKLDDGLNRSIEATDNKDILIRHFNCLK